MRWMLWIPILLTVLCAATPPACAQVETLPPLSELEPQPSNVPPSSAPGTYGEYAPQGPPLDYFDLDGWMAAHTGPTVPRDDWSWQILPDGIIYKAYLANTKESRMSTAPIWINGDGQLWDSTVGGRFGVLRYGTCDNAWPQGWQLDIEGSAQVRLDPESNLDLRSVDYRVGVPLTYGYGRHRLKLGYYHLCSHLGDEFVAANPSYSHVNYVRDTLSLGYAYYYTDNLRLYAEGGYAFYCDVGEEFELMFGFDYSPAHPTGLRGAPFVALHGHLREEIDFSGNVTFQAGWAWRGDKSSHLLRTGLHYLNGLSNQYSFYNVFEQQIGLGLWYDY
jgi:hypothetical protein